MLDHIRTALLILLVVAIILGLFAIFTAGIDAVFCHGCANWGEPVEQNYP